MNYSRIFLRLMIIIILSETLIMLMFSYFNIHNNLSAIPLTIADDLILLAISYIPVKRFVYDPFKDYFLLQIKESNMLVDVLKGSGESIIITDKNASIIYVNKTFTDVTGFSYDEVVGKKPSILSSGKQSKLFYKDMWNSLIQKGVWNGELFNKRKDGTLYNEYLDIRKIKDKRNKVLYYVGIFSDVSEKKAMENMVTQSQRLESIGTLVGGVAHNFNNLLAAIMGKAYLAKRNEDPLKKNKLLTDIEVLSNDSSMLIRQLLTFARETKHEKKSMSIGTLLSESVETAKFGLTEKITVETDITKERICVCCDPVHIKQSIINIINNARDALEYSSEKNIKVSLKKVSGVIVTEQDTEEQETEYAQISIKDKGTGIEGIVIEKIFDPFFTTKSVNKGTGLGLSTSIGTIKDHGGEIKVFSQIDKGTTFVIYLPIDKKEMSVKGQKNNNIVKSKDKETILIAEDDKEIMNVLCEVVKDFGYIPICAYNGDDAFNKFVENKDSIRLILTDIVMPIIDGVELSSKVRSINEFTPIIMMTGYDLDDSTKNSKIIKNNHTLIVHKPLNINKLSKDIYDIINNGAIKKI